MRCYAADHASATSSLCRRVPVLAKSACKCERTVVIEHPNRTNQQFKLVETAAPVDPIELCASHSFPPLAALYARTVPDAQ